MAQASHNYSHNQIHGGNVQFGDRHTYVQVDQAKIQRDALLNSLRFDEINLRENDVIDSHDLTFHWILEDRNTTGFAEWLKLGDGVYWIEGKAGSGKSTLLKFILMSLKTHQLLTSWSGTKNLLVLKFFFWLAGKKEQHSLKGCLCSLLYQTLVQTDTLISHLLESYPSLALKKSLNDWSVPQLREMLFNALKHLGGFVCLFLDGIDEFDQGESSKSLLSLIDSLHSLDSVLVKSCISSRPVSSQAKYGSAQKIRLQDLTQHDIHTYVLSTLQKELEFKSAPCLLKDDVQILVDKIVNKSDGVFLWVFWVLQSVLRGLDHSDTMELLLRRIDTTPAGIYELYQSMWNRLNDDIEIYRAETSEILAYADLLPLPFFDLMVASNSSLQHQYMNGFNPQSHANLQTEFELFANRLRARCTGFLELSGLFSKNVKEAVPLAHRDRSRQHKFLNVTFTHRTAYDFLRSTSGGRLILGKPQSTDESRKVCLTRARLAAAIEGFRPLETTEDVRAIMKYVGKGGHFEYELVKQVDQVGKTLIERQTDHCLRYSWFSYLDAQTRTSRIDFTGYCAYVGHFNYVTRLIENEYQQVSAYYKGYLILCATKLHEPFRSQAFEVSHLTHQSRLDFVRWLISMDADVLSLNGCDVGRSNFQPNEHTPLLVAACSLWSENFPELTKIEKLLEATMQSATSFCAFDQIECDILIPFSQPGILLEKEYYFDDVYHGDSLALKLSLANLIKMLIQILAELSHCYEEHTDIFSRMQEYHQTIQVSNDEVSAAIFKETEIRHALLPARELYRCYKIACWKLDQSNKILDLVKARFVLAGQSILQLGAAIDEPMPFQLLNSQPLLITNELEIIAYLESLPDIESQQRLEESFAKIVSTAARRHNGRILPLDLFATMDNVKTSDAKIHRTAADIELSRVSFDTNAVHEATQHIMGVKEALRQRYHGVEGA